jgi:hypothetical protein
MNRKTFYAMGAILLAAAWVVPSAVSAWLEPKPDDIDWGKSEYTGRDGAAEARADIAAGRLRFLRYGLLNPSAIDDERILMEKYGFESKWIAGCMVHEDLMRFASEYNAVMSAEFERRHGACSLEQWREECRTARMK